MNAKTITYTNAFYNRDVITITDIIDEKVKPKYNTWDTLLLICGRILLLVQKWMIACNYSMTMLQLHSNK